MNTEHRDRYTTRDDIVEMLSDTEIARVSTAETSELTEGDEYIDLTRLEDGVQCADGVIVPIGRVLPKKAEREQTWGRILEKVELLAQP